MLGEQGDSFRDNFREPIIDVPGHQLPWSIFHASDAPPATEGRPLPEADRNDTVTLTLTLEADFNELCGSDEDINRLRRALQSDLAESLVADPGRFDVISVTGAADRLESGDSLQRYPQSCFAARDVDVALKAVHRWRCTELAKAFRSWTMFEHSEADVGRGSGSAGIGMMIGRTLDHGTVCTSRVCHRIHA